MGGGSISPALRLLTVRGESLLKRGGAPALIDPASYRDREADLAMTRLFGGCAPSFYAAYQAALPLPPGWQARVSLLNLYHLNLFVEGFAPDFSFPMCCAAHRKHKSPSAALSIPWQAS